MLPTCFRAPRWQKNTINKQVWALLTTPAAHHRPPPRLHASKLKSSTAAAATAAAAFWRSFWHYLGPFGGHFLFFFEPLEASRGLWRHSEGLKIHFQEHFLRNVLRTLGPKRPQEAPRGPKRPQEVAKWTPKAPKMRSQGSKIRSKMGTEEDPKEKEGKPQN